MLAPYRCLDLCDEKGLYAGRLLGDMGADVIKVERPGGDAMRERGEKGLYWLSYNVNKRGVTLDLESPDGQALFRRLISTSDVVLESFPPGYLDRLGLGYMDIRQWNPGVILTSITPFGQAGPYSDYKTSDLVSMSMGGITWLMGDPDRPPVTVGLSQAFLFAGAYAAAATLIALYYREVKGQGQHVDVSIQQSLIPVTLNTIPHWTLNKDLVKRVGNRRAGLTSGASQRQTWRCRDGYITLTIYGGARGVKTNRPLIEWMDEEGAAPDYLKEKDWASFDLSRVMAEEWEAIESPIAGFLLRHTKAELFREAVKRGLMLFPVYGFEEILSDNQLDARDFWVAAEHPDIGNVIYPGAFARFSETPVKIRRPAPAVGEHNLEIYGDELGITEEELKELRRNKTI